MTRRVLMRFDHLIKSSLQIITVGNFNVDQSSSFQASQEVTISSLSCGLHRSPNTKPDIAAEIGKDYSNTALVCLYYTVLVTNLNPIMQSITCPYCVSFFSWQLILTRLSLFLVSSYLTGEMWWEFAVNLFQYAVGINSKIEDDGVSAITGVCLGVLWLELVEE